MAVDGSLNFDTSIDTSGFNRGTKSVSNSLGGLKSALGKVAVAAAIAFSVKQLIDFGKQAIETASDMAEVQNVVDTAFGSMSYKMEEFADNSIKQFGISKLAAKQTGSTFMAMASGMGLAQDNASDMAIALTGLSADMASFYNVSQDVASTALKSIFTGETETLKQFGIVMTDANLQAYALSQGINKSTSEMSQAEKVQLRYNYVMQQTSLAQGDFAKTQDSWANQTRILSEQWKEFGATIGSLLMNVFLPALKTLNNVLSQLISYAQAAVKALSNVFGIKLDSGSGGSSTGAMASDTAQLADDSSQAADNYSDMADSAKKAQKANEKSLASFDKINKLSDNTNKNSANSGTSIPTGTGSLAGQTGSIKVKADVETSEAQKKIEDFLKKMKSALSKLFEPMQKAWNTYGSGVVSSIKGAFNSIWELIKSIGKSFKDVWTNGSGEKLAGNILKIFKDILDILGSIAKAFDDAWNDNKTGEKYVQSIFNKFNAILELIHEIASSFKTVFSNGTGKAIIQNILQIFTNINNTITNIAVNFANAWKSGGTGTSIIQGLANILNIVLSYIKSISSEFVKWSAGLDFSALLGGINSLVIALQPLVDIIGSTIQTLFQTVLLPVNTWIIENAIPTLITTFSGLLDALTPVFSSICDLVNSLFQIFNTAFSGIWNVAVNPILQNFQSVGLPLILSISEQVSSTVKKLFNSIKTIFNTLWTGVVKPVLNLITKLWKSCWSVISSFWKSYGKPIFEGIRTAITNVKNTFLNAWKSFIKPVIDKIISVITSLWNNHLKQLLSNILSLVGELITCATTIYNKVISPIVNWVVKTLAPPVKRIINTIANTVKTKVGTITDTVKGIVTTVRGIIKTISGIASGDWKTAWEGFKTIFKGIWDTFVSIVKTPINLIIGLINKLTGAVESALNWIVGGINKLSFDVPDWVPKIGGKKFGFNIPKVDIPEIPKLAQGAVIPPNKEFLAVLGDQKRGTNIEAPLDTIKQAVLQALVMYGEAGNTGGKGSLTVNLNLDGKTISSKVIDNINDFIKRNGKSPIIA